MQLQKNATDALNAIKLIFFKILEQQQQQKPNKNKTLTDATVWYMGVIWFVYGDQGALIRIGQEGN